MDFYHAKGETITFGKPSFFGINLLLAIVFSGIILGNITLYLVELIWEILQEAFTTQ